MNWLPSIFVGVCAAPLTAFIVATGADSWARWLRIGSHEGASGYWVVMIALLAAIVGLILGICIARGWLLSTPDFWSALGSTAGIAIVATLLATGILWLATDHAPKIDGRPVEIQAELRFPPGTSLESVKAANGYVSIFRVDANETSGIGYFDFSTAHDVDGRITLPVTMPLSTSSARKQFQVSFTDDKGRPELRFPLDFGTKPAAKDFEWSGWLAPVRGPDTYALRFKVRIEPLPPPPLTAEQQEAQNLAQQATELRALAPDAPLAQLLVFTRYGAPQPILDAAVAAIRARPNYTAELSREMLDGEYESSRDALRLVEHLQPPPTELAPGIAAVGDQIAQSLRELEKQQAGTSGQDAAVNAISTRFSAWMVATRALQEPKVADFVPQLEEIIEPARKYAEVHAIRMDVVRVASFYLERWAGIAPLPTDPPPT